MRVGAAEGPRGGHLTGTRGGADYGVTVALPTRTMSSGAALPIPNASDGIEADGDAAPDSSGDVPVDGEGTGELDCTGELDGEGTGEAVASVTGEAVGAAEGATGPGVSTTTPTTIAVPTSRPMTRPPPTAAFPPIAGERTSTTGRRA